MIPIFLKGCGPVGCDLYVHETKFIREGFTSKFWAWERHRLLLTSFGKGFSGIGKDNTT